MTNKIIKLTFATLFLCNAMPALANVSDFEIVNAERQKIDFENTPILAIGEQEDYLEAIPATAEILAIYAKEKNAKFLSIENPAQYIKEGHCLLNNIPFATMDALGTPDNPCYFRLFCGTADDINSGQMYAVELCEPTMNASE